MRASRGKTLILMIASSGCCMLPGCGKENLEEEQDEDKLT